MRSGEVAVIAPSAAAAKREEPQQPAVSWAGLVGAALGAGPMAALAIELAVDPGRTDRALALAPGVMAAVYVPAVWASVTKTELRQRVLQGTLVASLVIAFVGAVFLGPVHLLVLAPATVLLWLATRTGR